MNTASIRRSARRFTFFATAVALLAAATLPACGTRLAPTVAHVSGRAVEVVEAGAGSLTVVFESGWGDDWTPWDQVAGEVAGRARVFAYSRPGYGESDPTSASRDPAGIVEELRDLLTARGFPPPYVLVGHSFGGTYVELFAKAHPEEVAGLVLVDTRHRDFTASCEEAGLEACAVPASEVDSLAQVEQAEYRGFARASDQVRDAGAFGPYPVRVLTATSHGFDAKVETLWRSMQASLAHEAADGEQIVFTRAGHYLQIEQAHEVTEVILSLVSGPAK